ncbi:MAG: PTPDL family protein [Verrucomicrobiota bacterium]
MKRINFPLLCVLIVAFAAVTLRADLITLKDGREIKCEILSEKPDAVLIEYYVTPTIKDQRFYSRDEIAHMVAIPADEKAFLVIGNLATPETVLDTAFYDQLIDKKIPEFLGRYRYSKHLAELREDLHALDEERSRVRRGDRRINGVWITAAQIAADPYQSGAKIKFTEMKELAATNDSVSSLQSYELLEKEFPGAEVMPDAIVLAHTQIDQLQDKLTLAKTNFEIIDKRRQKAIALSPADQAREIKDALQNEKLEAANALATATADGSKFFPIFQNSKESMDSLQTLIAAEKIRLTTLQKIPMTEGMAASTQCARLVSEGKLKEAQDLLAQSQTLWPANIENSRLKLRLDDLAKSQAAATAAAAVAAQAAAAPKKPTPSPTPITPVKP